MKGGSVGGGHGGSEGGDGSNSGTLNRVAIASTHIEPHPFHSLKFYEPGE